MASRAPRDVVQAFGGQATATQLRAHLTRRRIRAAVEAGELVRPHRGIYLLPTLPDPQATAAGLRGLLSHESAAQYWGIPTVAPPAVVHVTIARRSHPDPGPGVRVHQSRHPVAPLSAGFEQPSATSVLRTVLDCAGSLPFAQALAIADGALARKFVHPDELARAAAASRGPGRLARIRVARYADRRAENPFESVLRAILIGRRLTTFEPQCPVRVERQEWHLDLGDPVRRIAVEADSFAHHGSRAALARDCERYSELGRRGWLVLRFAWEHVMFRPDWVGDVVADALATRRTSRSA